ncbi:transposase InsO family protein [Bradyrhizobium elkanii]
MWPSGAIRPSGRRARQDAALKVEVRRVFDQNFSVYGVRKVWRQLKREGFDVARCTVSRLMQDMSLQGVIRGKSVKTTISDEAAPCPLDHVNRQFKAPRPNVYVAFVIDAYARRIVGWRASRTAHAGFVLEALEQALHDRRPVHRGGLVHHSDRVSQGGLSTPSAWLKLASSLPSAVSEIPTTTLSPKPSTVSTRPR